MHASSTKRKNTIFRAVPLIAVSLFGIALIGGSVAGQEPTQQQSPNADLNPGVDNNATTTTPDGTLPPTEQVPGQTGETSLSPTSTPTRPDGTNGVPSAVPNPGTTPAPMVIESDSTGRILIRGVVETVEPNRMVINSWGGRWTIRTSGTSRIIPAAANGALGDLSAISQGHFVGVSGKVAQDAQFMIDAELVRDWTTHPYPGAFTSRATNGSDSSSATGDTDPTDGGQDQSRDNNSSLELPTTPSGTTSSPADSDSQTTPGVTTDESAAQGETYRGRVEDIGDNTFTLNPSSLFARSRSVTVSAATLITDENGNLAPFVAIAENDEVQVEGSLTDDGTIQAATIRLERTYQSETGANTTTDNS